MSSNQEEFQKFLDSWQWPDVLPVFYRLYYDEQGRPIVYTMEDIPGKYIEVSHEQYTLKDHNIKIIDGKIVPLPPMVRPKLRPCTTGTPCHPSNVAVVVESTEDHRYWNLTNDQEN